MLDKIFAEKFIEKISEFTEYNVNIINDKGIIIASKIPSRIGEFHSVAYELLQGTANSSYADVTTLSHTHSGVNMVLEYHGKRIGVIGMTGNPKEVEPILKVMKVSMETTLEYELYKEKIQQHKNMKDQFLNLLLYGEDIGQEKILELTQTLGYQKDAIRLPILIACPQKTDREVLLNIIKNSAFHTSEDISALTRENDILIFKHFQEKQILHGTYKYIVEEYLNNLPGLSSDNDLEYRFYVGTFQNSMDDYRKAYGHCLWLKGSVASDGHCIFFYDYVENYIQSLIPSQELQSIFHIFARLLDTKTQREYVDLIETLHDSDYNLTKGSQKLFIHKNTLIFRLEKIKERFDMNPLHKQSDRMFLQYLCCFFKKTLL